MNQYILGELKPYRRRLPHNVLWLVVSQEGVWVIVYAFLYTCNAWLSLRWTEIYF
ncbi:hypothetical protein ACMSD9_00880 [Bacteroides thetaiotaomicron]|uniref:hypothetical protein n=1 Tax=Bacteroides thetaiotaomicron TaxID=818 RepID=UPI0039C3A4B3